MPSEASSVPPKSVQMPDPKPEETLPDEKSAEEVTMPDGWEPLPLDASYKSPGFRLYRYRGSIPATVHRSWRGVQQLEQLQGRPSDIIVAGFPKSGTTWLQEIVWRVTHHDESTDGGSSGRPMDFRFTLLGAQSQKHNMARIPLEEMADPRFIKNHFHYHLLPDSVKTSGAKLLFVSRDARDVCVSYYHFSRMLSFHKYRGTFAEYRDSFMRGAMVYGPYREYVKGYLEHSDTVLCLTYEQMHGDRASVVRKVADFLGVSLTDTDVDYIVRQTSFKVMKANPDTNFQHWENNGTIGTDEGTFMRKGALGDWKSYFTEDDNEAFVKWLKEEI